MSVDPRGTRMGVPCPTPGLPINGVKSMERNVQRLNGLSGGAVYGTEQHRVLRNTYWLLALSLLPTVLGAWVGVSTGIMQFMAHSPGISAILFLVGAYALMAGIHATRNSSTGVFLL